MAGDVQRRCAGEPFFDSNGACVFKSSRKSVAASATNVSIVAAVAGKKIYVTYVRLSATTATATTIKFADGSGGPRLSNTMNVKASSEEEIDPVLGYVFETSVNTALVASGGAGDCDVHVNYIERTP